MAKPPNALPYKWRSIYDEAHGRRRVRDEASGGRVMKPETEAPPSAPQWIVDLVGRLPSIEQVGRDTFVADQGGPRLESTVRPPWGFIGAALPGATDLSDAAFRRAVRELYDRIRETACRIGAAYPLRFWNLIPFIHEDMDGGMDRYMVFNAGRHDALSEWLEDPARFPSTLPTATGVGFRGRDLVIYCLTGERPGRPTENPRQRPAYCYSDRYGPLPPCFARAMLLRVGDEPTLLVGGTSSVRGENSVHVGSVESQIGETFDNLEGLVETVVRRGPGEEGRSPVARPGDRFHDLRVYHVRPEHAELVRHRVRAHFPNLHRLELVRADICRRDLLVEIEGVARVGAAGPLRDRLQARSLTAT